MDGCKVTTDIRALTKSSEIGDISQSVGYIVGRGYFMVSKKHTALGPIVRDLVVGAFRVGKRKRSRAEEAKNER